jgi:hypothetical protein
LVGAGRELKERYQRNAQKENAGKLAGPATSIENHVPP